MDEEEISYKTLRKIQQNEKKSPSLTVIPHSFYSDVFNYLRELETRKEKEDIPKRKKMLAEEIENVEKIVINIYEIREKKIIFSVISKARGGHPSTKQLLSVEQKLFDSISENLSTIRSTLFSKRDKTEDDKIEPEAQDKNESNAHEQQSPPLLTVRITKDLPCFIGIDTQTYHLKKGDVIQMQDEMAHLLKKRHAAEFINIRV